MHACHGGMAMGAHTGAEMDGCTPGCPARLSDEDRALHDRMYEACNGRTDERKNMKCFNWKVIAALAAIGIGLYALAPGAAVAAVPLLVLAACPLSMVLMMRAMGSVGSCKTKDDAHTDADEVAQLRTEVAALRAERQSRSKAR